MTEASEWIAPARALVGGCAGRLCKSPCRGRACLLVWYSRAACLGVVLVTPHSWLPPSAMLCLATGVALTARAQVRGKKERPYFCTPTVCMNFVRLVLIVIERYAGSNGWHPLASVSSDRCRCKFVGQRWRYPNYHAIIANSAPLFRRD